MAGKVPEMATMIVLCSLWRLITPPRYEPPLPRTFPAPPGPGKATEDVVSGGVTLAGRPGILEENITACTRV
jgi:hypothetical protein